MKDDKPFIGLFTGEKLNEIPIKWSKEDPIIFGVVIDDNDNIIIGEFRSRCVQVFDNRGKLKKSIGDECMMPTILDDKLVCMGSNKIKIYDLDSYRQEKTIDKITCDVRESQLFIGDGSIFIACKSGIYRINKESDLIEKVVEGALTSLSSRSYYPGNAVFYEGNIYMSFGVFDKTMNEKQIIKKYVYHKEISTVPEKNLTIWSVIPNIELDNAITSYKQQHPEVYVKYENLYTLDQYFGDNKGEVRSEDLQPLTTQLLSGEGPDIMVLDGLPIQSYEAQGILDDLTDCVNENLEQKNLLENVVAGYQKNGEIYAIPIGFEIYAAVGQKNFLKDGFHLKEIAKYQKEHPNEKVMFPDPIASRMAIMTDVLKEQLFSKDSKVDHNAMKEYLSTLKEVSPKKTNTYPCTEVYAGLLDDWMKVEVFKVRSFIDLQCLGYILEQKPDCILSDKIEGKENIIQGKCLLSINKNSENKEAAKAFIGTALLEENEGDGGALPVNLDALTEQLIYNNHSRVVQTFGFHIKEYPDGELGRDFDRDYGVKIGYQDMMKKIIEQCKTANVVIPIDDSIKQIMEQNTKDYFEGKMTLDETVNKVEEQLNIYISEQGNRRI